jgi:hypothetical protein
VTAPTLPIRDEDGLWSDLRLIVWPACGPWEVSHQGGRFVAVLFDDERAEARVTARSRLGLVFRMWRTQRRGLAA